MDGRAILAEPTKEFRLRPKILMHISGSKRNPILKRLANRARASIVQRHCRQIAMSAVLVRRCLKNFVLRIVSASRRRGPKTSIRAGPTTSRRDPKSGVEVQRIFVVVGLGGPVIL